MIFTAPFHTSHSFTESSRQAATSILTAKQVRGLVRSLSNTAAGWVALIFAVPFCIVLYFMLVVSVRKMRRSFSPDISPNKDTYKALRKEFEDLGKIVDEIRPIIQKLETQKLGWTERLFAKKAVETMQILANYHEAMAAKFSEMDKPSTTLPDGWRIVTGSELWENRPKPYEYLV